MEGDTYIYQYGENEVERDAAYHHKQTLPRRLGTEISRLGRLGKLFLVHGFIDHSGYLHIASERKPAYAVFSVAPRGLFNTVLIIFHFLFLRLPFGYREPRIEEKIEFLDLYAEYTGHEIMAEFMYYHKKRQCHYKLQGLHQNWCHQ